MGSSLAHLDSAVNIAMIGLDGAGKSTVLYRLKFDAYISTIPTVGFNCERVRGTVGNSRGISFVVWDVGGQERARSLWRAYVRSVEGLLFVIDSSDPERLEEARIELQRITRISDVASIPVLIIANKQDLMDVMSPSELEQTLGLNELRTAGGTRSAAIVPACAITGEGLDLALDKLYSMILDHRKALKQYPKKKR